MKTIIFFGLILISSVLIYLKRESIKNKLIERIKKNTIEQEVSWMDSFKNEHKEKILLKKSNIPLIGDWTRVYSPINLNDKSWNWFNLLFGGKKNLYKLLLIFLILGILWFQMNSLLGNAKEYMDGNKYIIVEKEAFFKFCDTKITTPINYSNNFINLSLLKRGIENGNK